MTNKTLRYPLFGTALLLSFAGCASVTSYQGTSGQTIIGTLPAPPPPPPKAEAPPRVELRDNKIVINEKVQFDLNKATIKAESDSLLDEVGAVITKAPYIKKISIDGFASAEGNAAANKKLSDARAKSVMAYLVGHGIDKARLTAKGWGIEKPIADNTTEEGREKNRRVEFNIIDQDVTQRKVAVDPKTGKVEKVLESSTQEVKTDDSPPADPAQPKSKRGKNAKKGDQ